jgi:2,4-dienoyl-CoA reductase-like NADH-dependent reductase (Old Yellow Enzyme family)
MQFFPSNKTMKNRFALAPMTNTQSHEDGSLSEDELHWLTMRAKGDFGMVMTCASHVQKIGQGFPGQLGIFEDRLMEGHKRISEALHQYGSLAIIQLHHAGMRSPVELTGEAPVCPSENQKFGARALSLEEVYQLRDDFITAARRSKDCGYDGVELHGAHGYIICQFLSGEINSRTDAYGGSFENRARLLWEMIEGIREECGQDFMLGVRLSPERFGLDLGEIKVLTEMLAQSGKVDFLDISLWDCFKLPENPTYQDKTLLEHFTGLDYANTKLTVAGKIKSGKDVKKILDAGVDFVTVGRSAILHHDFPKKVAENPDFEPTPTPVTAAYLKKEGLGDKFVEYMRRWKGFVGD